jgi:hypothetical protein
MPLASLRPRQPPKPNSNSGAGEPLELTGAPRYGLPEGAQHQSRAAQIAQAELELDLHVDPKTALRVRQLHAAKQDAVQARARWFAW